MSESISSIESRWNELQKSEAQQRRDKNGGGGDTGSGNPPGGGDVEVRVARLESDIEYIKRDIAEIKADVRQAASDIGSIKLLLGTFGGGLAVALAILAWIANNRFDTIIQMLAK